jgi:hypothetical protein
MKAIHGGKAKSDKIDAHKIAALLRGGTFPIAYGYVENPRPSNPGSLPSPSASSVKSINSSVSFRLQVYALNGAWIHRCRVPCGNRVKPMVVLFELIRPGFIIPFPNF